MIYKCKICGGTLDIKENSTTAICEYCGTKQTLPRLDSEKKSNLLDRANHFRRLNEYDKALSIYEQILAEDKKDSEIYWLIVLCKYGIEYVEDPVTKNRIPTINRVQYNSILKDSDYLKALDLADSYQKEMYIEEANKIDDIQKGILEISNKEEPFDIFICYKETDENGRRTEDSVLAQNVYKELTNEGYKVFFSRITLEDKIGMAYEPYIFAALNSSKVMLVIGTKKEYFNSVWVKNEWSRYLSLINKGDKKLLVPCYKNMDPYDLPEEFAYLQAQDINKLGYMQDLLRGINKVLPITRDIKNASTKEPDSVKNIVDPLITRLFNFIKEKNWKKAEEYSEKILDMDPNNGYAYLGKLLIERKTVSFQNLIKDDLSYKDSRNFKNMMKSSDYQLLNKINKAINIEAERIIECNYSLSKDIYLNSNDINKILEAVNLLKINIDYQDSKDLITKCELKIKKIEEDELENKYLIAKDNYEVNPKKSLELFSEIKEYKDSKDYINKLEDIISDIDRKNKIKKVKAAKLGVFILAAFAVILVIKVIYTTYIVPYNMHKKAVDLIAQENYQEAYDILISLNLENEVLENKYSRAIDLFENEDYLSAYEMFILMFNYKDSRVLSDDCLYMIALSYEETGDYTNAIIAYKKMVSGKYLDQYSNVLIRYCKELISNLDYFSVINLISNLEFENKELDDILNFAIDEQVDISIKEKNYESAMIALKKRKNISSDSEDYLSVAYLDAMDKYNNKKYEEAIKCFGKIANYKDSSDQILLCKYKYVLSNFDKLNDTTIEYLTELSNEGYKDCKSLLEKLYEWKITMKVEQYSPDEKTAQSITVKASGGTGSFDEHIELYLYQERLCDIDNNHSCEVGIKLLSTFALMDSEEYRYGCGTGGGTNTVIYYIKDQYGNTLASQTYYCYE